MRAVLQRVTQAEVRVEGEIIGAIKHGWLVLLGIGKGDRQEDLLYICDKIANLRAFNDSEGKFNLPLGDVGGEVLVVSQFTLYGDCRKGRRPGFSDAALPADAEVLYEGCITHLKELGLKVQTGKFQANMQVSLTNDGPVTLLLDSQKKF